MAYYGIYSAGVALTASTSDDTIVYAFRSANALTSNTVLADAGSDIINLGTQGQTTTAIAGYSGIASTGMTGAVLSAELYGSAGLLIASNSTALGSGYASGTPYSGQVAAIGVVTSQQAVRTLASSQIWGNAGNDTIALGAQLTTLTSSTIGGGAGNDQIGSWQQISAGAAFTTANLSGNGIYEKTFIEGGGGDDTISIISETFSLDLSATTIQGGQGNDIVALRTDGSAVATQILLGGGDDILTAVVSANGIISASTVAGGGGNDLLNFDGGGDINKSLITLDTFNSVSQYDGNDTIVVTLTGSDVSSNTIQAGFGNDVITLSTDTAAETNFTSNLFQLGAGNDTFSAGTSDFRDNTIQAGAGQDSVYFLSATLSSQITLGGDNDFLQLQAANVVALAAGTTVNGGLGADLYSATNGGNGIQGMRFAFSTYADSTLSAMDTIAIGGGNGTQFQFNYSPGSVLGASFQTASTAGTAIASATNGVVTFQNDAPTDLTARVAFLDNQITTEGQSVIFNNSANDRMYLFIQAGTAGDLVTQIGTAGSVSGATFAVAAGGKSFSATIV